MRDIETDHDVVVVGFGPVGSELEETDPALRMMLNG
jgi:hypothetical protein